MCTEHGSILEWAIETTTRRGWLWGRSLRVCMPSWVAITTTTSAVRPCSAAATVVARALRLIASLAGFDYGNAENHMGADGAGTMEAIYYGNCTSWWVASDRKNIPKVRALTGLARH